MIIRNYVTVSRLHTYLCSVLQYVMWRINKCQFTHVFRDVIFIPVSILLKLIFLSIYVCVFDEKWLQSVRNLSLEQRHVFAL